MSSTLSILVGRFLLGLYFFVPGLMKIAEPANTVAYMESHGVPLALPLLWVATAANLIGGLLLMTGRYVQLAAYGSVLYILVINFFLHDFWNMSGDQVGRETQNFIKNLGIAAGLLALAGYAPGRALSVRGWWRSDKASTGR